MLRKILLIPLLLLSVDTFACENQVVSEFDHPQSLRYRIDSIMHYSSPNGELCIKRMPNNGKVEVLILHPKKVLVLAVVIALKNSEGKYAISPYDVAKGLICENNCSPKQIMNLKDNPDVNALSMEVSNMINNLEPPYKLVNDDFRKRSSIFLKYLSEQNEK